MRNPEFRCFSICFYLLTSWWDRGLNCEPFFSVEPLCSKLSRSTNTDLNICMEIASHSSNGGKLQWRTGYIHTLSVCSVQSLSCVQLFATPRTAAHQASLSITNSRSLFKLMSHTMAVFYSYMIYNRSFMKQLLPLFINALLSFVFYLFFVFNAGDVPLYWFHSSLMGIKICSFKNTGLWVLIHSLVSSHHLYVSWVFSFNLSLELQTLIPNSLWTFSAKRNPKWM